MSKWVFPLWLHTRGSNFEALGIDNSVIDRCFAGTASRIKGVTFEYIAQDAFTLHERGYPTETPSNQLDYLKLVNIIGEMVVTHTLTIQLPLPHYRMLFVTK